MIYWREIKCLIFPLFFDKLQNNRLLMIDGPSGSGKSTTLKKTLKYLIRSVSALEEVEIFTPLRKLGEKWQKDIEQIFGEVFESQIKAIKISDKTYTLPSIGRTLYSHAFRQLELKPNLVYTFEPSTDLHKRFILSRIMKVYPYKGEAEKKEIENYGKKWKKKLGGKYDFTEMLEQVIEENIICSKIKWVFIDEFENLNFLQYKYLFKVFPNATIILIGDLLQSILSFGGVEFEFLKHLVQKIKEKGVFIP